MSDILSISPLDNRYWNKINELSDYFSEYAIIKSRFMVEILYYEYLLKKLVCPNRENKNELEKLITNFNVEDAFEIKEIEKTTNHDIKAIEYFIQKKEIIKYPNLVHFGLTSADVSSLAFTFNVKNAVNSVINLEIEKLLLILSCSCNFWKNIPMLGKTHGQPASPTTLGKEMYVFYYRLNNQLNELNNTKFTTKFGGAVGNLNAHLVSYPNIKWDVELEKFVKSFGIERQKYTTQIENYDDLSSLFNNLNRICVILIDLCRDIWLYISMNYFSLDVLKNEVGSSTMPHKVNPINFENAEGNLLLSSSLFNFFSNKLPISRLQRDLTDSTVSRNVGVAFGHLLLGLKSLITGLKKIKPNENEINRDLNENSIVLAEALQTLLRKDGINNAYDIIKNLTRGENIKWKNLKNLLLQNNLENVSLSNESIKIISDLDVNNYIGNSKKIN